MAKTQHIYLIPGLGATRTVFEKTALPKGCVKHYIDWLDVTDEDESLDSYIERLSAQVKHKNPIFVGLSFGGIMAMELSKRYNSPKVVLVSSFRSKADLKWSLRVLLNTKSYRLIPNVELSIVRRIVRKAYAMRSKVSEAKLLEMMGDESPLFLRWAVKQIDEYRYDLPESIELHSIIGDNDKLVDIWKDQSHQDIVPGGTHIAVYADAETVNGYLGEILG